MARKKKEDNLEELEDSSEKKKKSFLSFGSEKESTKEQRLVFFGFYAVFFIIVAFMILGGRTTLNNQNNNGVSPEEEEEYTGLVAPNYNYEYKIEIDDNTYIYSGKRLYSKDLFTYSENDKKSSYYKEKDTYYKLKRLFRLHRCSRHICHLQPHTRKEYFLSSFLYNLRYVFIEFDTAFQSIRNGTVFLNDNFFDNSPKDFFRKVDQCLRVFFQFFFHMRKVFNNAFFFAVLQ